MNLFVNLDFSPNNSLKISKEKPYLDVDVPDMFVGDQFNLDCYFINNQKEYVDVSGSSFQFAIGNKKKSPSDGSFTLTVDSSSFVFNYTASAEQIRSTIGDYEVHGQDCAFSIIGANTVEVDIEKIQPESIGYITDIYSGKLFQIKSKPYAYATGSSALLSGSTVVGVRFALDLETREMIQAIPSGYLVSNLEVQKDNITVLSKDVQIKNQLIGPYLFDFEGVKLPTLLTEANLNQFTASYEINSASVSSRLTDEETLSNILLASSASLSRYNVDSGSLNNKIDQKLNTSSYQIDSASFAYRIDNNTPIGFVTTSSFNSFTSSLNAVSTTEIPPIGSKDGDIWFDSSTAIQYTRYSGSWIETGGSIVSAGTVLSASLANAVDDAVNLANAQAVVAGVYAEQAALSATQANLVATGLNYKGVISASSIPNTSSLAGDCYLVTSTASFSSQGLTWNYGDLAIYKSGSGQWNNITGSSVLGATQVTVSPYRNSLAPRGGLSFNGGNSRVLVNLSGSVEPMLNEFTFNLVLSIPSVINSSNGIIAMGPNPGDFNSSYPPSIVVSNENVGNGRFVIATAGPNAGNFIGTGITNWNQIYGGKTIMLTVVKSGSMPSLYINGLLTPTVPIYGAGSGSSFTGSVSASHLGIGYTGGSNGHVGTIHSATLFNYGLSSSEVGEVYENGGRPKPKMFTPNYMPIYYSNFTGGTDSWGPSGYAGISVTGSINGINGEDGWLMATASAGGTNGFNIFKGFGLTRREQRVRVQGTASAGFDYSATSLTIGNGIILGENGGGNLDRNFSFNISASQTTTFDGIMTCGMYAGFYGRVTIGPANVTASGSFFLKGIKVIPLAAVAHYDSEVPMIGYQWPDSSMNRLDGTISYNGSATTNSAGGGISVAGCIWSPSVEPTRRGTIRARTTTLGNQQLLGQPVFDQTGSYRINSWVVKTVSGSATATISLGNSSGGTQYALNTLVTNTPLDVGLATRINATQNLFCNSNISTPIQHFISYERID